MFARRILNKQERISILGEKLIAINDSGHSHQRQQSLQVIPIGLHEKVSGSAVCKSYWFHECVAGAFDYHSHVGFVLLDLKISLRVLFENTS